MLGRGRERKRLGEEEEEEEAEAAEATGAAHLTGLRSAVTTRARDGHLPATVRGPQETTASSAGLQLLGYAARLAQGSEATSQGKVTDLGTS